MMDQYLQGCDNLITSPPSSRAHHLNSLPIDFSPHFVLLTSFPKPMAYEATLRNALLVICTCYAEADLQPTDTPSRLERDLALKVLTEKPRTSRVRCKLCR
jgi:hypothetical protein